MIGEHAVAPSLVLAGRRHGADETRVETRVVRWLQFFVYEDSRDRLELDDIKKENSMVLGRFARSGN